MLEATQILLNSPAFQIYFCLDIHIALVITVRLDAMLCSLADAEYTQVSRFS